MPRRWAAGRWAAAAAFVAAATAGAPPAAAQVRSRPAVPHRGPVLVPQQRAQPHFQNPRPGPGGQRLVEPPAVRTPRAVVPNVQRVAPDAGRGAPDRPRVNPDIARPGGFPGQPSADPARAGRLNFGPGRPNFSPAATIRPGRPAFPAVSLHDRFWPIVRDRRFMWLAGRRRFFVPVGLLGVAAFGGAYWYPDAYVAIDGPACTRGTPDGCQLRWRPVDFDDDGGGGAPQCVQYCPQTGPAPQTAMELPEPPALAPLGAGACDLTIFSNPGFGGLSAPTSDGEPELSQAGWRNEISSIKIRSGTWDFYSEESYQGELMRLTAGDYPQLAPEWNKRIGSFMCTEPGDPGPGALPDAPSLPDAPADPGAPGSATPNP